MTVGEQEGAATERRCTPSSRHGRDTAGGEKGQQQLAHFAEVGLVELEMQGRAASYG